MTAAYRAKDVKEAFRIRAECGAVPYAGGTDLMVRRRRWWGVPPDFPGQIVFIGHLDPLKRIREEGDRLIVGACCTFASLLEHERVPPSLRETISQLASPAVRNLATLGGNICNASPAADSLPYLYGLDAVVACESVKGKREVGIRDFVTGPGSTVLMEDELVTEILIPLERFDKELYRKVSARKANALSKVSFLGLLKEEGGRISDVRLCFGAVGPMVVRNGDLERRLLGRSKDDIRGTMADILEMYSCVISPINDQRSTAEYRKGVCLRLLEHFLTSRS